MKKLDSGSAVGLLNLIPVFGLVFAALALHEAVNPVQILGGIIVIGGVMLTVPINHFKEKKSEPAKDEFLTDPPVEEPL